MSKKRVAVLVTGQARFPEYASEWLRRHGFFLNTDKFEYDFHVHTWTETSAGSVINSEDAQNSRKRIHRSNPAIGDWLDWTSTVLEGYGEQSLSEMWNASSCRVTDQRLVLEGQYHWLLEQQRDNPIAQAFYKPNLNTGKPFNSVLGIRPTREPVEWFSPHSTEELGIRQYENSINVYMRHMGQLMSLQEAVRQATDYSSEQGFKYDYAIRIRHDWMPAPDNILNSDFIWYRMEDYLDNRYDQHTGNGMQFWNFVEFRNGLLHIDDWWNASAWIDMQVYAKDAVNAINKSIVNNTMAWGSFHNACAHAYSQHYMWQMLALATKVNHHSISHSKYFQPHHTIANPADCHRGMLARNSIQQFGEPETIDWPTVQKQYEYYETEQRSTWDRSVMSYKGYIEEATSVINLTVDINTACNAACPGCARQDRLIYKSQSFPNNIHMKLDLWKKIIDQVSDRLEYITFVGNFGDAAATRDLPDYIQYAVDRCPTLKRVQFDSNMGLQSPAFWKRLAQFGHKLLVRASIDGLEDTNHIYRRFVRWKKVQENTQAFVDAGGICVWKFIRFPWNAHQIEEARQVAHDWGISEFDVKPNNQPQSETEIINAYNSLGEDWSNAKSWLEAPDTVDHNITDITAWRKNYIDDRWGKIKNIICTTQQEKSVHINWDGRMWPCCWHGAGEQHEFEPYRQSFKSQVPTGDWNDLNVHTMEQILQHPWYSRLMETFTTDPIIQCVEVCGVCSKGR